MRVVVGGEDMTLQDVVALAPLTFSSLLGLNMLFFCAFLFGTGGDKKLEKRCVCLFGQRVFHVLFFELVCVWHTCCVCAHQVLYWLLG